MKYAILGTGMVGQTLAHKLLENGHQVMMGSRSKVSEGVKNWVRSTKGKGVGGTFSEASQYADVLFNCTKGEYSLEALKMAGKQNLIGKLLIDVSNPLDFSQGMPPRLLMCNDNSLGEEIQKMFPRTNVVKALNTVNCAVMVKPSLLKEDHDLFICGNDENAKRQTKMILCEDFGWKTIHDLGDITNSRGTEQILPLWMRLYALYRTGEFNFKVVKN